MHAVFLDNWEALLRYETDIDGTRKIHCALCNQVFRRKDHLKNHAEAIHLGVEYKCSFCEKVCRSAPALRGHVRQTHEQH